MTTPPGPRLRDEMASPESMGTTQPSTIVMTCRPPAPHLVRAHKSRRRRAPPTQRAVVVVAACSAAAAALLAALAASCRQRRSRRATAAAQDARPPPVRRDRRRIPGANGGGSDVVIDPTLPPELAAAIPRQTLRPLCALLETVYSLRGWRGGGYHYERAWERCLEQAQTPEGGGWVLQFDASEPSAVTPRALRGLARAIDGVFFGGALHGRIMRTLWEHEDQEEDGGPRKRRLQAALKAAAEVIGGGDDNDEKSSAAAFAIAAARRRQRQPWRHCLDLEYAPDPLQLPQDDYVAAYDSSDHVVRVSRRAWATKLRDGIATPASPLNCEGWRVESLLAALAHSLAHELVHAMVAACFPDLELKDASYLGEDGERHGPAFALLNRQIFGHTHADALEHAQAARAVVAGG